MFENNRVQTGFAEINGGKLYYEVAGDGPALVLAHAGIADRRMWDDQFLVFAQHFRVIRCDFWGFGKSTTPKSTFSLHQDLYRLLKFLGVVQVHLMGCSLGGRVSIDLALEYPKLVNSLILVGSGLSGYEFTGEVLQRFSEKMRAVNERNDFDGALELVIQLWVDGRERMPDQVDPRVRARVREMLMGHTEWPVAEQPLEPPATGRLAEIDVPTLIIVGDRDEVNIATIADLLVANVHGARKIIMPETAHLPNMEKPEHFNRVVLEFLRSNRP
jgi:pimeloyl-ACP methyl ester carboxylesterase